MKRYYREEKYPLEGKNGLQDAYRYQASETKVVASQHFVSTPPYRWYLAYKITWNLKTWLVKIIMFIEYH